jgi:preprotein translocase subunit SecA
MDRMGYKEGEVIQHSMISKSIERAQKKVEENNFGTRKRLLEFDDVMNKQRNVIYTKRHHALLGERLGLDIDNSIYDICEVVVNAHYESRDFESFRLGVMMQFSVDTAINETDFSKIKADALGQQLYHEVKEAYKRKNNAIIQEALPVLQSIRQEQPQIENIVIPFSDAKKGLQITCNLDKVLVTNGQEIITTLEKTISLVAIDDQWKDHLRQMDDLKTSVQSAVYEQKDPLLIYKFEAFELFNTLLAETNREILNFLMKVHLHAESKQDVQQARPVQRTDMSRMRTQKDEFRQQLEAEDANRQAMQGASEQPKAMPVHAAPKIGRNDSCPCGSGKKYKNCHGKDAVE